jgi:cytochrome c553
MRIPKAFSRCIVALGTALIAHGAAAGPSLVWDSELKEIHAVTNQATARFSFSVTNVSSGRIVIEEVRPSCGCTLVRLPAKPWKLAPGASGGVEVEVDLFGKSGVLIKTLTVASSEGTKDLVFKVHLPEVVRTNASLAERVRRQRNQQMAAGDRQAVFRNDCARCHAEPARGKSGRELYTVACGICHDTPHRASMVPDLNGLPQAGSRDYWRQWITHGKPGSLMPAFAVGEGGPLQAEQIDSLIEYLRNRRAAPAVAAPEPGRPTAAGY